MKKRLYFLILIGLVAISAIYYYSNSKKEVEHSTFEMYYLENREYKLYVPSGIKEGEKLPLVVMLHGCTQNPDIFAKATSMNEIAEVEKFIVLYPMQTTSANYRACWNWFNPNHQMRDYGEPKLIVDMVNDVKSKYFINDDQVYVAGFSAGGAMAVILGITYPDVFKAIGVGAGMEYKAATNGIAGLDAMESGGPDPVELGTNAYHLMNKVSSEIPIVVFHGAEDYTVVVQNGHQIISQFATINDLIDDELDNDSINDTPDEVIPFTSEGQERAYTRYIYYDTSGKVLMEKYIIEGMSHSWSGGDRSSGYTDYLGPNQSVLMWEFFKQFK